jgi:transcriptional regulator with XRE-family HTH domain
MSRVPNQRLTAARVVTGLTQQQLADLGNLEVERATGRIGAMDADYISKLERGVITWPSKPYRRAIGTVLGRTSDTELGFYSTRSRRVAVNGDTADVPGGIDDVNRNAFLKALAAAVGGMAVGDPVAEAVSCTATGNIPTRVGMTEVAQVNHAIDVFGGWQDLYGGGVCRDALAGQVTWAVKLLGADAPDTVKQELYRSVGFLVDVAGWGAFDAGHHQAARNYFRLALHCAEQGNDWGLRANVLSDMARQAVYIGQADDGLSLIELAQVRQDRQTSTVRAMLSTVRARSLAKLERDEEAYGAVRLAEDEFANQPPGNDPDWITYFNEAHLYGDTGHAMLDIAMRNRYVEDTRDRLRNAVTRYTHEQARSRAFAVGKLGILELTVGDPQAGMLYGRQALTAAAPLRSRRAADDLKALQQALATRPKVSGSEELRWEIQKTVGMV